MVRWQRVSNSVSVLQHVRTLVDAAPIRWKIAAAAVLVVGVGIFTGT